MKFQLGPGYPRSRSEPTIVTSNFTIIITTNPNYIPSMAILDSLSDHKVINAYISLLLCVNIASIKYIKNYARVDFAAINHVLVSFTKLYVKAFQNVL